MNVSSGKADGGSKLNTIRSTIEGRLATELNNSPQVPVVFHNMAYEPTRTLRGCSALSALTAVRI